MVGAIVDFVALCRRNGLNLSPAETTLAVQAVAHLGLADRAMVRAALEAILVRCKPDRELFSELFELFFYEPGRRGQTADADSLEAFLRARGVSASELEALMAEIAHAAARFEPLLAMALGLRRARFEALLRLSGHTVQFDRMSNPLQAGFFSQQLLDALRMRETEQDLLLLESGLARKFGQVRAHEIAQFTAQALDRLRHDVRRFVGDEFKKRNLKQMSELRQNMISEKPFSALAHSDIARLQHEVDRMAQTMKDALARRRDRSRRGPLDVRKTISLAVKTGGVPVKLRYRRKKPNRQNLVLLCDISDSVRHASRFLLQFAFVLRKRITHVRCFVFVADIAEATDLFTRQELQRAIDAVLGGQAVSVYANSNYGRAFATFARGHIDAVTSRSTVIILGDGRNNYNPPETWALAEIARRARRVLWWNPEPPLSWAFGDSAMRSYEPEVARVEMVYNVESLRRAVDGLLESFSG